jgi:predicted RNA-binding Zn-ribbon protein involved in translation (DUF1610 family)
MNRNKNIDEDVIDSNNIDSSNLEDSQVYLCSGCGGNMEYDISSQKLKCPYCGVEEDIQSDRNLVKEYDFSEVAHREANSEWNNEVSVVKCDACGAETVVEKYQTALHCGHCGSSHVLESKQSAGIKPEGIIPFKVDAYKAKEEFHKWIKGMWLAPNNLKQLYQSEKLISVYVPYWTYDAETYNSYTAQGGEHYYVTVRRDGKDVRERRTRWHFVSGNFNMFFDDVQVNASKNYNDSLMIQVEPYNTKEVELYKPQFISGHTAERYSKGVVECFQIAKDKIYDDLEDEVRSRVRQRYDEVRSISIDTEYSEVKYKHVLLPLWTAQYDYKGKKYRYMINGQTGEIAGEAPISPIKVTLLILLILAAILAGLYFTDNLPIKYSAAMIMGLY